MNIEQILQLIKPEMTQVNHFIEKQLYSDVVLINQISQYIIHSGGKRLRPILHLLCSRAISTEASDIDAKAIKLAAVIEFIHTATLLHDDVVDESELRRGKETANELWGNAASVLVGDFLYSRAFEIMVSLNSMRVMEVMSHSTNTIAEGEVLQLLNCHDASTDEARYLQVIHCKTAKLFESSSQLAAILAQTDQNIEDAMAKFGMHLGTAFQIIDDVLDYSSTKEEMGKNIGDDLSEGKPTLPLIYAMNHGNAEQSELIKNAIESGGLDHIQEISAAINATGALDYARNIAKNEAQQAINQLSCLPDSEYKKALIALTNFSVNREY